MAKRRYGFNDRLIAQTQRKKDEQYVRWQKNNQTREPETSTTLRIPGQCSTILGGRKVWKRGQYKDQTPYVFPIIVGGTRCDHNAILSYKKDGRTVRYCSNHLNIEWVDVLGKK